MVIRDRNEDEDRRAFLKTCGRFASVTPPVMTLLLSTSLTSRAIASSGGLRGVTQSDGGTSIFDNDRPSAAGPASSSGGSSGSGGALGGGSAASSRAAATSGNGGGSAGGGGSGVGGNAKGPFATGDSGIPSADGGVDCTVEENGERRKADCPGASTRISSVNGSGR